MNHKTKNLSKLFIIYQLLYMTDNPTRIIRDAVKSLKLTFRKVLTNQEKVYREAEKYQLRLYEEAWNICFEPNKGHIIEIGTIVNLIYDTVDKKEASKYIGSKKMDKVLTSYFLSNEEKEDAYEVESRSTRFAKEIIRLYDGEQEISAFQRMMNIKKQNHVIETGDSWDEFKQTKDICIS